MRTACSNEARLYYCYVSKTKRKSRLETERRAMFKGKRRCEGSGVLGWWRISRDIARPLEGLVGSADKLYTGINSSSDGDGSGVQPN